MESTHRASSRGGSPKSKLDNYYSRRYSVLLSLYHRDDPEWLREAIDSILAQSVQPDELVVVKDGPLGNTLNTVVSSYTDARPELFKVVELPENVGLGLALREGVENCSNELIARMDSDDLSEPDRMEKQLAEFDRRPDLDVVGSLVDEFTDTHESAVAHVALPEHHNDIAEFAKRRIPVRHSSLMFRKSAVLRAGNYRHVHLAEDYDLVARLLQTGSRFYNIQEVLHYMRVSRDFYRRRGGLRYLASIFALKNGLRKSSFITWPQFLATFVPHAAVVLMPGSVRVLIYKRLLRKSGTSNGVGANPPRRARDEQSGS